MERPIKLEYTIWDDVTPLGLTSSTDASPVVVTKASHGLSTGDRVVITGHATNVAINGIYEVVTINANTFSLKDINTGEAINGSGAGAGSGGILMPAKILRVDDFSDIVFHVESPSTPTWTLKFAVSEGKMLADSTSGHGDTPNFGAAQTSSNPYTFADFADTSSAGAITDGDTGLVCAGAPVHSRIEINVSGAKYVCPIITAYTSGVVSAKARLTSRD